MVYQSTLPGDEKPYDTADDTAAVRNNSDTPEEEYEPEEKPLPGSDPRTSWEFERDLRLARITSRSSRASSVGRNSTRRVPDGEPLSRHQSLINTLRARKTLSRNASQAELAIAGHGFTHPLTHTKTSADVIVDFEGPDDPYRPVNWPFKKKVMTTAVYGLTTMGTTLASAIFSTGQAQVAQDFGVGEEVATLGTALFLFGMGIGPLVWAPLSEVYGRKLAVLTPYFIAAIFAFGTATAKDIQTVCITRFFAGFFGAAPVTNTGGVMGDLWAPAVRANAIAGYAMAVVGGPTVGPLIGSAIVDSYLRWRWTEYITGIYMMFMLLVGLVVLDESYPPQLLVYKARRLRHSSGNWALHAHHEEWDVSFRDLARKYLVRPFQMLTTPIGFLVALYASFVYGIIYAYLAAFPLIFQGIRGWSAVVGSLPFLAILVGIVCGVPVNIMNQRFYQRRLKQNNNRAVPEARLPPMMIGGVAFTTGLFLFAWTCSPASIFWFVPIIGCWFMGLGFFTIFQAALNYLVDTFSRYGASAIAANTFLRSVFAGGFPLFIGYMFDGIGPNWSLTIFGCFSALLIPVPFVFYVFGRRIRARGKWSQESL